jgi:hypothetical protein
MEDIKSSTKCGNMAGNKSLFIIPINEISSIDFVDEGTKKVTPRSTGGFSKVDIYDLKADTSPDDDAFSHEINGNFRTSQNMNPLFNRMKQWRFVVKIVDNNNQSHLYGSIEEPLRFTYEDVKNADPNQAKEYKLSFYGNTTFPAFLTL